jgi:hypothetical protein
MRIIMMQATKQAVWVKLAQAFLCCIMVGARLVVPEGLSGSGKTRLTKRPFATGRSLNIEIDQFFPVDTFISPGLTYLDVINWELVQARLRVALASAAPVVIAEWPKFKMTPFAPILRYHGRRQELNGLVRSLISNVVDVRDPIQIAYDQLAQRAEAMLV